MLILGGFILFLLAIALYLGLSTYSSFTDAGEPEPGVAEQTELPAPAAVSSPYQWSSAPAAIPVSGCIANESTSRCMCFSADGITLDIAHAACLSIINTPFPRNITAQAKSKNE